MKIIYICWTDYEYPQSGWVLSDHQYKPTFDIVVVTKRARYSAYSPEMLIKAQAYVIEQVLDGDDRPNLKVEIVDEDES